MLLISAEQTESRLLDEIKKRQRGVPGISCYYLPFAQLEKPRGEIFQIVSELLNQHPISDYISLFLCEDGDMFFFAKGWNTKTFQHLVDNLVVKLNRGNLPSIVVAYDLFSDHEALIALVEQKRRIAEERKKEAARLKQEQMDEQHKADIFEMLDPVQVASLYGRREQRQQPCIMVADDDQLCRTLVANTIDRNCSTAIAANGKETVCVYVERAPDVLFLDIGLPDVNGHALLETIFSIDPEAYIIMFSGQKSRDNVLKALEKGARGFLGKPFTRGRVLEYVGQSPFVQQKAGRVDAQQRL